MLVQIKMNLLVQKKMNVMVQKKMNEFDGPKNVGCRGAVFNVQEHRSVATFFTVSFPVCYFSCPISQSYSFPASYLGVQLVWGQYFSTFLSAYSLSLTRCKSWSKQLSQWPRGGKNGKSQKWPPSGCPSGKCGHPLEHFGCPRRPFQPSNQSKSASWRQNHRVSLKLLECRLLVCPIGMCSGLANYPLKLFKLFKTVPSNQHVFLFPPRN